MEISLDKISVIAELERIGWEYIPAGGNELKVNCPAHKDNRPSCAINVEKRLFKCQAAGCGASGDIISFVALALSSTGKLVTRAVVWEEMQARYGITDEKTIDPATVERWHEAIWSAGTFLAELRKRYVSDAVIRERRLGFDGQRITIPIPNSAGMWINVRKYLPGAPSDVKMRNMRGHSQPRIYPIDQLSYEVIIIAGGEMKAIVTAERLNPSGIGVLTVTAGEGEGWSENAKLLKGKKLYICMDVDEGGRLAAALLCARFKSEASWVGDLDLSNDLPPSEHPHGDLNDYWALGKSEEDMLALIGSVPEWKKIDVDAKLDEEQPPAKLVSLAAAGSAKTAARRIAVRATVSAMDTTPYLVPQLVRCICNKDQGCCDGCPVYSATQDSNGAVTHSIPADSPAILSFIGASLKGQRAEILKGLKMPACRTVKLKVQEFYNVEDLRLSPQLEMSSQGSDAIVQPCFFVGHGAETNCAYELEGRVYPRPDNQQAVLLATSAKPSEDALANHVPSAETLERLKVFKPEVWTVAGIKKKLDNIYEDLEANVTRIYQRRDLHIAADLSWHSALTFKFDGREVKGWTEVLLVGDSSQGKSDLAKFLLEHYGLGKKVDCKSASVPGLLGGLTPMGNRWMISWGFIPRYDRRHVILEELKGAEIEVISKLTEMRSSGIAEVNKIEKWKTYARTRLFAISNARGDRPMSRYNFGVEALVELIGSMEDLRRFDLCMIAAADQVDAEEINKLQKNRPQVKHVHTKDLCKSLILWAWTRTADQVIITPEAEKEAVDQSRKLCQEFTEVVPLIDRGSTRYKLARLATALAARTFSANEDGTCLVVQTCHVTFIAEFLRRVYSEPSFGYKDYSDAVKAYETIKDVPEVEARLLSTPFPKDVCEQLLHTRELEARDLADWCGWDKGDAVGLLSFFVRKHCLLREGRGYRKTSAFIGLLKNLLASKRMVISSKPSHIKDNDRPLGKSLDKY